MTVENLILMLDNAFDTATIAASSAAATLPVTNLQEAPRTTVWRSSGTTGTEYVNITLPAARGDIEAVAVVDHNLALVSNPATSTIRVQSWTDSLGGTAPVIDATYTVWTGFTAPKPAGLIRPVAVVLLPAGAAAKYWRITLVSETVGLYIQAGRIYMGPKWQPAINMEWGHTIAMQGRTSFLTSRGGQRWGSPQDPYAELSLSLAALTDAEAHELWLQYLRVADHTPFPLCLTPEAGAVSSMPHTLNSFYCTMGGLDRRDEFVDRQSTSLRLIEDL